MSGTPTGKSAGFQDAIAGDTLQSVQGVVPCKPTAAGLAKAKQINEMAVEFHEATQNEFTEKPFVGALPKFLRQPDCVSEEETENRTEVASKALAECISLAPHILLILGEDAHDSLGKDILDASVEGVPIGSTLATVAMASSWMHTLPCLEQADSSWRKMLGKSLLIYVGTPGKYLHMCTKSKLTQEFDTAFKNNSLAVICRGCCMLPIGTQVQNIHGIDADAMTDTLLELFKSMGPVAWGHGKTSKASILSLAYPSSVAGEEPPAAQPPAIKFGVDNGDDGHFDFLADYVTYLNKVKLSNSSTPIVNYYDTGMLVGVCMGAIADRGISLLTDHDGLCMLRDASIGHTMSKLNQLTNVSPQRETKSVYNFFIGDGASRLNGGAELTMHLIQDYVQTPMITVFLFNNHMWAIEDNLVGHNIKQHALRNTDFYDLLQGNPNVCICNNTLELRATLEYLSSQTHKYMAGAAKGDIRYVIIRGLDVEVPPLLGNLEPIVKSSDMAFLRDTLGKFAEGCSHKVPIYGCSAFEYIQFLDIFMQKMPEGQAYQYICGRTDIQAAHMCGFRQTEGKCVLMINDVYGINSLGESLRSLTTGFKNDQLLIMIWHPTLTSLIDNFHLHRPPMVWPSLGSHLCQYYVRSQKDLFTFDFKGRPTSKVADAITQKTPLIVVSMLPEHERRFINLDVRMNVADARAYSPDAKAKAKGAKRQKVSS
mmetsp:Transcript_118042/g.252148  ORF Transcript_118042/g.252148 Transcript_118042/m.252148 type:complete len:710 (+) Transcript_118042:75-2204(+)